MGTKKTQHQETSEQRTQLPEWLQPAMERGIGRAESVYQQGAPMMNFTPWSAQTDDSMNTLERLARSGAGVNPAMANYEGVLGGDYLMGGAGFDAALNAASNRIIPQVQSMFSRGGRTNSGLAQTAMTQALGDSFASLYDNERARQMQALGMAPQMTSLAYQPAQILGQVGAAREAKDAERFDIEQFNRQGPARSLDEYLQRIQGVAPFAGGTTFNTSTRPLYENRTNALLGGLASGAGLLFGGAPFAAGGRGLLGMLR